MPIEIKELYVRAVVVAQQQPIAASEALNIAKLKREIADEVLKRMTRKFQQKNER
jgi:Cys-tRNA synthase (O-phospho-L-seryl-tRNA:Cys-tRNA synthase)